MVAKLIRITDDLEARGKSYAAGLGISFNALAVLALSEYLDGKKSFITPGNPEIQQKTAVSQAVPLPAEFALEPSPPADVEPVKSRQQRRGEDRSVKKANKPQRH